MNGRLRGTAHLVYSTLKFYLLDHVVENLERSANLSFTDAGQFEHSIVPIEESYTMKFPRYSTRKYEKVQSMRKAVESAYTKRVNYTRVLLAHSY